MIRQLWNLSVHARAFLRHYMPTNILLDALRTRRGLKWGIPAMLLAAPYLLAAAICTTLIADGGPGWLNLLVLLCLWNTIKVIIIGPVSLILLIRAHAREAVAVRAERRAATGVLDGRGARMHLTHVALPARAYPRTKAIPGPISVSNETNYV